MNFHL